MQAHKHPLSKRDLCVAATNAGSKKRTSYFQPENMVTQEGMHQGSVPAPAPGTTQGRSDFAFNLIICNFVWDLSSFWYKMDLELC